MHFFFYGVFFFANIIFKDTEPVQTMQAQSSEARVGGTLHSLHCLLVVLISPNVVYEKKITVYGSESNRNLCERSYHCENTQLHSAPGS
jgi:hypothetical protein